MCIVLSLSPLIPNLMVASIEHDKEAIRPIPDIIPNMIPKRRDDCEQVHPANTKILQRATLKTDFYLIPIMGMCCVSFQLSQLLLLVAHRGLINLISRSDLFSFLVSGSTITHIETSIQAMDHGRRIDRTFPL